jgi:DNA-binding NarL/FixJ family response regulator
MTTAGNPASNAGAAARAIRVLLADPDPLARSMVRRALQDERDIRVVGDAGDGLDALQLARFYRPRVVLLEAALPRVHGLEVVREITRDLPDTRAVMLCAAWDDDLALDALSAGAVGFLTKDVQPPALPHLVRKVAEGQAIVPLALIPRVLERLRQIPDAGWRPVRSRLTTREWEIVDLIAEGATTQQIAERLVLSPATVYSHVKSLMRKLGVHSRRDAIQAAQRLRREEAGVPPGRHDRDQLPDPRRARVPETDATAR